MRLDGWSGTPRTPAFFVEEGEEFGDGGGFCGFVVDDDVVEFGRGFHFGVGGAETNLEVVFGVVGAGAQAGFEGGEVGDGDEDEDGLRDALSQGAGTLEVGADEDGLALVDELPHLVAGDATAVAVDLSVFEEAAGGELCVEVRLAEEDLVNAFAFAGARFAGLDGDDAGQAVVAVARVTLEGGSQDGVFAGAGGAGENDNEGRTEIGGVGA